MEMAVQRVMGRGEQEGPDIQYKGGLFAVDFLSGVSISIVIEGDIEDRAVSDISGNMQERGKSETDGYFSLIGQSTRVRTGEVEV